MKIGLVVPVKPSHPYLEDDPHRCLTSTICAFHLGFGLDVAQLTIESAREARHKFGIRGKVHLFMAVPAGLALLIGQSLNTLGPVQTYEHIQVDAIGVYEPAAVLGQVEES